jgi:hypothetical protein
LQCTEALPDFIISQEQEPGKEDPEGTTLFTLSSGLPFPVIVHTLVLFVMQKQHAGY